MALSRLDHSVGGGIIPLTGLSSSQRRDRHLQVLATMARTLGSDPLLQQQLYTADTAAHAYEILHLEAIEDFNYFLEDPESPVAR